MALPTSTNDVTARKLGSVINSLWTKIKSTFVKKTGDTMTGRLTLEKPLSQVIIGTGTAGSSSSGTYYPAKWKYDLGIANPTQGDQIVIKLPCAGSDYGCFISTDNGTTYYPVARHVGANRHTTQYGNGSYICVVFEAYVDGNSNAGQVNDIYPAAGGTARTSLKIGCWRIINDYDSGNTICQLRTENGRFYAGSTGCTPYSLVCLDKAGKYSMLISSGSGTGTSKTINTAGKFKLDAVILYYNHNSTAAANAIVPNTYQTFYAYHALDTRYSHNHTTTFATNSPLYIECTIDSDGYWSPTTKCITQTLETGKYYIYLGMTYSTEYQLSLFPSHPLYYYDGTNLTERPRLNNDDRIKLDGISAGANKVEASSTNGKIKIDGTDTTVYTHPTQTAYSAKGSATKVPKITTDSTGHVTSIEEVTISGVTPASHTHGNIANGGTLTDTAAAAAGNDYVVIRDADNAKIQTSTIKGTDVADAVSKKHSHSTLTLSTTAQAYDGTNTLALPSSDPYTSARTPTSHTHGNIANGGTLTDTAAAAAGNDYVVIRDADNAKIQTSTIKGTDVADAVSKKHSHSTLTLSTTAQAYDGSHTLALPSTDPYTSARTPTSHASSATTYGVGTTANYGHVKLDNSTPLTVGTTSSDGVAAGKAHIHNALESVARASVTTADLAHINTNTRAHMILSQITSQTSTTHDPGDGYMLSFMWDNTGSYDAQLFIPDAGTSSNNFGRLKIRYANNSAWGDWEYLPPAFTATLLTSADDLDTLKGDGFGNILGYRWESTSTPTHTAFSDNHGAQLLVFGTSGANYATQIEIRSGKGIYQRRLVSDVWGDWEKVLVSSDITTGTANGTISVAGSDVAVKGLGGAAYLNTGTTSGTVATGNHTHTTSIAEDTGTATVTLAHNKTYKLTSGGTSVIFKTPTDSDANTIPSAYCDTAAGTAAKTASCTNYTATPDTYLHVLIRYANTSAGALTLNVNGQGAKPIYINGAVSSSSNYTLPAGTYIAYYDGTNYWLRTDGRLQASITGTAGFADAVYNRSNQTGDGWFKLAETKLQPRTNSDNTAIWDVALAVSGGGIAYEKICLDVRFNSSGDGVVSRFVRTYEADWTGSVKFAVLVSGQGGSGNTQVQLWAWQNQAWRGISIRQAAGNNWSLSKYNNSVWTYYSADTGGTSKPVADATNHISVTDSTNVHMRAASFIATGTLPVARGGTGAGTAAGAQYNLIDKATTDLGTMGDAVRIAIMTTAPSATNSVFAGYRTGSSLWTYMKGKMSSDTGVNISGNAATASAAQSGSALETAINGKAPTSHTHGNITNGGALQTNDITIASGDKLVVTDSSDSNKVARTSVSFDGSTTTTALTPKGTFESFAKASDISTAIGNLDSEKTSTDGTNVQVKVTEADGKISAVNITTDTTANRNEGVYYVAGTTDYPAWVANHAYAVNDNAISGGKAYYCKTAHTSGSSFDSSKWTAIVTPVIKGTITGVTALYTGIKIALKWPITGGTSSTYLNINNLGNVYIRRNDGNITTHLPANSVSFLAYDGTYWRWADYDSNSTYSGFVCGYCSTAAGTAAKEVSATNYSASVGNTILVRFTNTNSAAGALTLKAGGVTKTIKWNGTVTASGTTSAIPAGTWPCYYDGTYWNIWTDGTIPGGPYLGGLAPFASITSGGVNRKWGYIGKLKRTNLGASTWGTMTFIMVFHSGTSDYSPDTYICTFESSASQFKGKLTLLNGSDALTQTVTLYTKYESSTDSWLLYVYSDTAKLWVSCKIYLLSENSANYTYKTDDIGFLTSAPTDVTAITRYIDGFFSGSITDNHIVMTDGTAGKFKTSAASSLTVGVAAKLGTADKGSSTKPIYLAAGVPTDCTTYAGGTAVTLNNSSKAGSTASFYAPTAGGTANYVLIGNGTTSAPTWAEKAPNASTADTAAKISTSAKIGDTNKPVYVAADGTITAISYTIATSVPSGAVFTDTKQRIVASDSKTYLTGVTTAPTSSNQDLTGVANTNVYATAGQLHATTFDVNSKCTLQFNTTTNALDFVFA